MNGPDPTRLDSFRGRNRLTTQRGPILPLGLLGLAVVAAGCTEQRVVYNSWATLEEMADETGPRTDRDAGNPQAPRDPRADKRWTVLITSVEGPNHRNEAAELVMRLRREARATDLWVREGEQQTFVYKGAYREPTGRVAVNARRQVRMIKLGGKRPFARAQIVPVASGDTVATNPFDLRQFPGYYSLQIEVYDDGVEAQRDVAEARAHALRDEGNSAFFYHGPHRSMVTVGLFTRDEAFVLQGTTDVYAPSVRDLQSRHPRNLHNGATVVEKENGQAVREQPSFLVYVR